MEQEDGLWLDTKKLAGVMSKPKKIFKKFYCIRDYTNNMEEHTDESN